MAFFIRKRIRLGPGVHLNLGATRGSLSIGRGIGVRLPIYRHRPQTSAKDAPSRRAARRADSRDAAEPTHETAATAPVPARRHTLASVFWSVISATLWLAGGGLGLLAAVGGLLDGTMPLVLALGLATAVLWCLAWVCGRRAENAMVLA